MDEPTRQYALQKLEAIKPKIGYPDKWEDFSAIYIEVMSVCLVLTFVTCSCTCTFAAVPVSVPLPVPELKPNL